MVLMLKKALLPAKLVCVIENKKTIANHSIPTYAWVDTKS
jgi:hypothetical protein